VEPGLARLSTPVEVSALARWLYRDLGAARIADVARELVVGAETFRRWVRQDEADRGERGDWPTTAGTEELRRLRR
jgi:transposase